MAFVAGHFGEWLQGRLGSDGPVVLVTLRCAGMGVAVERVSGGPFRVEQDCDALDPSRTRHFLCALGHEPEGRFRLKADFPPGGGAGVSTAALVALARAAGCSESGLLEACLAAEGATDPLMVDPPDAVLWASREGRIVEALAPPPACDIVGAFWGPAQCTDAADLNFPDVSDLVARWRAAATLADHATIAAVSSERTTELRGPGDDPTPRLAKALGALGHARAHTGSARALIFEPGTVPEGAVATLASAGYSGMVRFSTGCAA